MKKNVKLHVQYNKHCKSSNCTYFTDRIDFELLKTSRLLKKVCWTSIKKISNTNRRITLNLNKIEV